MPDWQGMDAYQGQFIHAQLWDPEVDFAGKKILLFVNFGKQQFAGGGGKYKLAIPRRKSIYTNCLYNV